LIETAPSVVRRTAYVTDNNIPFPLALCMFILRRIVTTLYLYLEFFYL